MSRFCTVVLAFLSLAFMHHSTAQFPERPIRLLVGFPAGGNVDQLARLVAHSVEEVNNRWKFIVDNQSGANGIIATQTLQRAAPDGYTIMHAPSTVVMNQVLYPKVSYDVFNDITPITQISKGSGYVVAVNAASPLRTLTDIISAGRDKSRQVTYGSFGVGGTPHFMGELINMLGKTNLVHVPYKSAPLQLQAALGGEVDLIIMPMYTSVKQVAAGKLRAVAFTGTSRTSMLPDVPTFAEAGLPDFSFPLEWDAWWGPARLPAGTLNIFVQTAQKTLRSPKLKDAYVNLTREPIGNTPAEFMSAIHTQFKLVSDIATRANIKAE